MKTAFIILTVLILAACQQEAAPNTLNDPSPDQLLPATEAGLTLSLEEVSYTSSPSILKTRLKNESRQSFEYGDYYYIEVKKEDGWFILTHSDAVFLNNPQLTDYGRILLPRSQVEHEFSIDMLGITLPPGQYRVIKTFLSHEQPFYEISLSVPFTVE